MCTQNKPAINFVILAIKTCSTVTISDGLSNGLYSQYSSILAIWPSLRLSLPYRREQREHGVWHNRQRRGLAHQNDRCTLLLAFHMPSSKLPCVLTNLKCSAKMEFFYLKETATYQVATSAASCTGHVIVVCWSCSSHMLIMCTETTSPLLIQMLEWS